MTESLLSWLLGQGLELRSTSCTPMCLMHWNPRHPVWRMQSVVTGYVS